MFPDFNTFLPQGNGQDAPWSKAGGILPVPIDGRYLMYFGEGSIYYAWSDDLIHWTPGSNDEPVMVPTAPGTFGEFLVEVGPPPIITDDGLILLLHNAAVKNRRRVGALLLRAAALRPRRPAPRSWPR